ncbi:AN1-type zinc finger protein (macronuclear) [Tetrahymena thermophila SB210]|uniref:AN1-type zinc finger protein n=1 Tax=Tetrahymena thermophila (strain SB210) TaxID=312017 RepID=Q24F52_TETTS|nr:AN1-type zinc finger protein [Tetrahymena thermophila SB210]EAS06423.1 AN1-type zinc finger protein [Tetrahymena thermophila SB210]|eukprot:XP_001026668.1 AN1-type zinc finger protein [Tetrahymena thermophila SB210]
MEIGKHCAVKDCNQLDFLPFQCSECNKNFCQNHRYQQDHNCEKLHAQKKEIDIHNAHKAPKCPVKGCKNVLSIVNEFTCEICKTRVCLTHRYEDAHECKSSKNNKDEKKSQNKEQKPAIEIQSKQEKPKKTSFFMCCFSGKPKVDKKQKQKQSNNNQAQIVQPQKQAQK